MRVIFMGSPEFGVPTLKALMQEHEVVCVYTQPPRASGRTITDPRTPVHRFADENGLPVRTPVSLKGANEYAEFAALKADVAVVAAYGLILPKAILDAPKHGCINVHASLLPRWRGASPIQHAILHGDEMSGVTIMQMDEGLDTGDILMGGTVIINDRMTAGELHDRLMEMSPDLVLSTLRSLTYGATFSIPQDECNRPATYSHKLEKHHGKLDFTKPARELERMVRAFDPWPGTFFEADGDRIKVLKAEVVGEPSPNHLDVRCGDGRYLRLLLVQKAGKKPIGGREFLNGFRGKIS